MKKFSDFVHSKQRKNKEHLKIIKSVLEQNGFKIKDYLNETDPYIYVKNDKSETSFGGIRIYIIGEVVAYRVQKKEDTHPYGSSYLLNIEDEFNEIVSDGKKSETAAKKTAKYIVDNIKDFFEKSGKAEKELNVVNLQQNLDPMGSILARTTGTDYSNTMHSNGNNY